MDTFSNLGAGVLTVTVNGTALKRGLTEKELEEINQMDRVKGVSPTVTLSTSAARNGEVYEDVSVKGKNEMYFRNNDDEIAYGRGLNLSDMAGDVYVCVVDMDFAEAVFAGENPIGKKVTLGGRQYTVVGLQSDGSGGLTADMSQGSDNGSVIIPYKNAMKINGISLVQNIDVYLDDVDATDSVKEELESYLDKTFNDKDGSYWIMNLETLTDTIETMTSMLTALLAGIASISLLVGGIGIMNMMLVSVTERTKEIGLRKALGAEPSRIQVQFLIEAVILSLAGGFAGMLLGIGVSAIAAALMETSFRLSAFAIELGVGFSAAVGIIFGWAPAKKASELSPIDALRSE
ncbi:MAG: ABC transporter permease, partial [Ruminococcus sp.]|nr:ABC transporter permease [Ruminococcus sp.]